MRVFRSVLVYDALDHLQDEYVITDWHRYIFLIKRFEQGKYVSVNQCTIPD